MKMLLVRESRWLALAAIIAGFFTTWCWRAKVRLEVDTFIEEGSLLIWAMRIVWSNMDQAVIRKLPILRLGG
jgi:hypothetical protein